MSCELTSSFPYDLSLANNKLDFGRLITRQMHFQGGTFPLGGNLVILLSHLFGVGCPLAENNTSQRLECPPLYY